jgi:polyisoprenoid-binding protein YceI
MIKALLMTTLAASSSIALADSATYKVEPTHTFVTFEVQHFGTSTNRGRFDKKEGTISFDAKAKTGKADISVHTSSINTGVAPFDSELKKDKFLNAAKYPTAQFVGDQFQFEGDKITQVTGNLTLLGKTQPVTLIAKNFNCYQNPMLKREVCGGDFETTFQRSGFGMTYGLPGIPDDTKLVIQIEAVRQ